MLSIFFSDYNLIQRWSAELIHLKNNLCIDTETLSSYRGDVVGVLVSGWGERKTPLADVTGDYVFN